MSAILPSKPTRVFARILIEYRLAGGVSIFVRPSGTEPKTKIYMHQISAQSESPLPAIAADFRAMIVGRQSDQ